MQIHVQSEWPDLSFVKNGGLWIKLLSEKDMFFSIEQSDAIDSNECMDVISGKIIIVLARELLQCLFYPELEMEILGSIEVTNTVIVPSRFVVR